MIATIVTDGVGGVVEKMAMAFLKMSRSCASRLLAVRNASTSVASAGSGQRLSSRLRPRVEPLGVNVKGVAGVERLSPTTRRASARKSASYLQRLPGFSIAEKVLPNSISLS